MAHQGNEAMAVEGKRGCGFRKVGGLYMMGGKLGMPCCKLPRVLDVCPTCAGGIKQSRGWQWIDPRPWLRGLCVQARTIPCPAAVPDGLGERAGLLWIGTRFYSSPEIFAVEADKLGISRRIKAIPRGFELGIGCFWRTRAR